MSDEERAYQWLWAASMAAGCLALLLVALYYWRHSERSILTDFTPSAESLNGSGHAAAPGESVEALDSEP